MSEDKYVDNENVSVSEPQNESNTDAQKPLSIEDALAAAELAAGELETMAAADGEIHTAKEKPETGESATQEIGAASFDPSMFDPEDAPRKTIPSRRKNRRKPSSKNLFLRSRPKSKKPSPSQKRRPKNQPRSKTLVRLKKKRTSPKRSNRPQPQNPRPKLRRTKRKKPTSERQPTKKRKTKNNRKRPLRFPKDFARNSRPKRTSVCLRFSLSCCPFFARR